MPKPGDSMFNPQTGETFTFLKTGRETDGQLLQIDVVVKPTDKPFKPDPHIHPIQEERFIMKAGSIRAVVNGVEKVYRAGETVIIPPGAPHDWINNSGEDAHFICEFEPALRWDELFESIFALSRDGKLRLDGPPNLLLFAVGLRYYQNHYYLGGIPISVQKVLFAALPCRQVAGV